jgi:hypothetical protein
MDRKELEAVLKELVIPRLEALAEDIKRIDSNLFLMGEKLLSGIEQRQLKRAKGHGGNDGGGEALPRAAKDR